MVRGKEELSLGHEFDVLILKQGEDYCSEGRHFQKTFVKYFTTFINAESTFVTTFGHLVENRGWHQLNNQNHSY